jgi:hypothetical protein
MGDRRLMRRIEVLLMLLLLSGLSNCELRIAKMTVSQKRNRLAVEQARIRTSAKAVEQTDTYITISRLLLSLASDAVRADDVEDLNRLMDDYIANVESARDTIITSNVDAARHPKAYQQLEIALRIEGKLLRDLQSHLTIEERTKVEKARLIVAATHEEMIQLIFPASKTTFFDVPRFG